jgi:hypothetical protein
VVPAGFSGTELVPLLNAGGSADTVDLVRPIQGGQVLFVGALVRAASGTSGSIRAELRRGTDDSGQPLSAPGAILVFEERSTMLVPLDAGLAPPDARPGWQQLQADISELANVPACPNFLPVDIPDQTLYVQVKYTDAQGNSGTASAKVVPRCRQSDPSAQSLCLCECHANYTSAKCFMAADGGSGD